MMQTRDRLEAVFFDPFVSESGRGMKESERKEAETLMDKWKLDVTSPDFQKLDSVIKQKLTLLQADFDAMKSAAAAHAQYVAGFASLRAHVRLTGKGQLKWHIVSGGGKSANIFNGEPFSTTVGYGGTLHISLTDPVNGRSSGGAINLQQLGPQSISAAGDRLDFEVSLVSTDGGPAVIPKKPQPGPKKADVLRKLR